MFKKYFLSNKKDFDQKTRQNSKNEHFLYSLLLGEKSPPTCFTQNQPKRGNFQNRLSPSCGDIFDSNLFCWTNQH